MNTQEQQTWRNHIERQLADVNNAITNLNAQRGSLTPDSSIGRISRMEAIEAASVNSTKMANYQRQQRQLQQALLRLVSDPNFGYCEACGERIATARFELIPQTTRCVGCAP